MKHPDFYLRFVYTAVGFLVAGPAFGMLMAFKRREWVLRLVPTHTHFNLLGWVNLSLCGLAYFAVFNVYGYRVYSPLLVDVHYWLAILGMAGMAAFWFGSRWPKSPVPVWGIWVFGAVQAFSSFIFVFNIAKSVAGGS